MAVITIRFKLNGGDVYEDFEVSGCLESEIIDRRDELVEEDAADNPDYEDEYGDPGYEVAEFDDDYDSPGNFDSLDEYADYVDLCDKNGEGFKLRWDDIGEISQEDYDNSYHGCWDSAEEFVREFYEDCYDIPDHLDGYIDWGSITRDVMMDYSSYDGRDGVHIFRD